MPIIKHKTAEEFSNIKFMSVKEFREKGYLQELNRLFLHPLGLALSVAVDDDGDERIAEIWDSQEDDEGIMFSWDQIDQEFADRAMAIQEERLLRDALRREKLGWACQPFDWPVGGDE